MIVVLKSGESISTRKPLSFQKGGTNAKRWYMMVTPIKMKVERAVRVKDVLAIKGGIMKTTG